MSTIQVDFNLPERFNISYIDADGKEKRPIMLHRATFGSYERFLAMIIEHFQGAFPTWLAPVQMTLLPIADRHIEFAEQVNKQLLDAGFRSEVDTRSERLQAKIRDAALQKVPFMGIIGDKEIDTKEVSVRMRGGEDLGSLTNESLINKLQENIDKKI